jgi:cytoskeleton protein RodZ
MIKDFGSYLKSERELRGVTLDELHSKTNIPVRYLEALEKNQFDELPEEVFIRGYIRSVSNVIGAQEDEVLSTYMDMHKIPCLTGTSNQSTSNIKHPKFGTQFIFLLSLAVLILLGTLFGINILIQNFNKDATESTTAAFSKIQKEIKEESPINLPSVNSEANNISTALTITKSPFKTSINGPKIPIEESPNTLATKPADDFDYLSSTVNSENPDKKIIPSKPSDVSGKKNTVTASSSANEKIFPLKLSIRVKGDIWFNIKVDNLPVESFVLSKGSDKIFYGNTQYLLNVGNKNLIELTLNGKSISIPNGNKDDILTNFTINAQLIE